MPLFFCHYYDYSVLVLVFVVSVSGIGMCVLTHSPPSYQNHCHHREQTAGQRLAKSLKPFPNQSCGCLLHCWSRRLMLSLTHLGPRLGTKKRERERD